MNTLILVTILSTVLGIIFFTSAIPKLRHPEGFLLAVLEYRVLSPRLSRFYARLVPPLEFLIAILLLTGIAVRTTAIVVSMLLLSFIVAIGINLARGRDLNCHCFGKTSSRSIGWKLLLQDVALLGSAIIIAVIASEWIAPEPWSVFRLSHLVQADRPWPLLGCIVVVVSALVLFGRSIYGRSRYRGGVSNAGGL